MTEIERSIQRSIKKYYDTFPEDTGYEFTISIRYTLGPIVYLVQFVGKQNMIHRYTNSLLEAQIVLIDFINNRTQSEDE